MELSKTKYEKRLPITHELEWFLIDHLKHTHLFARPQQPPRTELSRMCSFVMKCLVRQAPKFPNN
eukprot:2260508-Amphidinium_carterae.1